ncbi:MAG: hypothetical protein AAF677_03665 [Pseudomonadota bacterium]
MQGAFKHSDVYCHIDSDRSEPDPIAWQRLCDTLWDCCVSKIETPSSMTASQRRLCDSMGSVDTGAFRDALQASWVLYPVPDRLWSLTDIDHAFFAWLRQGAR